MLYLSIDSMHVALICFDFFGNPARVDCLPVTRPGTQAITGEMRTSLFYQSIPGRFLKP